MFVCVVQGYCSYGRGLWLYNNITPSEEKCEHGLREVISKTHIKNFKIRDFEKLLVITNLRSGANFFGRG